MDARVVISIVIMFAIFGTVAVLAWRNRDPKISGPALTGLAQILSVRQPTGPKQEGRNLPVQIELRVQIPGRQPYDVKVKRRVDAVHTARLHTGATIPVQVDETNPQKVVLDFNQPS
jgi:hypothetical protein